MPEAPEPFRTACLEVVYWAAVEARSLAWGNAARLRDRMSRDRQRRIADLMDAVHNIPHLLNDWGTCDQDSFRDFLVTYDRKWTAKGGVRLAAVYDQALRQFAPPRRADEQEPTRG